MKYRPIFLSGLALLALGLSSCGKDTPAAALVAGTLRLGPDERLITILATNDIHGGLEPQVDAKSGQRYGGMAILGGMVSATKQGLARRFGDHGGVLVLDAGDQFQGTLISNYNEGALMFETMNDVGYDAAIPGNHDYDFGPTGWLEDQVSPRTPGGTPRQVIERLQKDADFPLISANTYLRDSLRDFAGNPIEVDGEGCKPKTASARILWATAQRPAFLTPYAIKTVAGVRVALVGIDNPQTPSTTTGANVSDLCFRDEAETYREVRASLEGQADVFVMILHNGDAGNYFDATDLLKELAAEGPRVIDAIVAGHTHYVNNILQGGIPAIQSGSGGALFGRIDLVYDTKAKAVLRDRTRSAPGARLQYAGCDAAAAAFCSVDADGTTRYEGVPLAPDEKIAAAIAAERARIAPMTTRVVGVASAPIQRGRITESPLADIMTDAFRKVSGAQMAFLNTGGMRDDLPAGTITYEQLFKLFPFNNRGLVVGPMRWSGIKSLLVRSVQTCGSYGSLMESGLRVTFTRDCAQSASNKGVDPKASLSHVELLGGDVLFDAATHVEISDDREFQVATLDFLATGGDHFDAFKGIPVISDLGIIREALADELAKSPGQWQPTTDGRWVNLLPEASDAQ